MFNNKITSITNIALQFHTQNVAELRILNRSRNTTAVCLSALQAEMLHTADLYYGQAEKTITTKTETLQSPVTLTLPASFHQKDALAIYVQTHAGDQAVFRVIDWAASPGVSSPIEIQFGEPSESLSAGPLQQ